MAIDASRKRRRLVLFSFVYSYFNTLQPNNRRVHNQDIMAPLIDLPRFHDELAYMSSLRTIAPGADIASIKRPNARRKYLKTYFRQMRKISASRLDNPSETPHLREDIEPLKLGQRIVFRSQGQVPVKSLVALHRMIRNDSIRGSELATIMSHGQPTRKDNSRFLCVIRNLFEE